MSINLDERLGVLQGFILGSVPSLEFIAVLPIDTLK